MTTDPTREKRRHPRREVFSAVMVTPNGDRHRAHVLDLSAGGARVDLPADWVPSNGARLKVFFRVDSDREIALDTHVVRVAIDHLGLEFDPAQDERIEQLLEEVGQRQ
jgi:hypothetical protein